MIPGATSLSIGNRLVGLLLAMAMTEMGPSGCYEMQVVGGEDSEVVDATGDDTVAVDSTSVDAEGCAPGWHLNLQGSFVRMNVGDSHACGLKVDGTVACWGSVRR